VHACIGAVFHDVINLRHARKPTGVPGLTRRVPQRLRPDAPCMDAMIGA